MKKNMNIFEKETMKADLSLIISPEEPLMKQMYALLGKLCTMYDFTTLNANDQYVTLKHDNSGLIIRYTTEERIMKSSMNNSTHTTYKKDFEEWIEKNKIKVFNKLSDVTDKYDFDLEKGQKCTFINDYGIKFEGHTIMGFGERDNNMFTGEDTGRYVYLDKDSYWLPTSPKSIIIEKTAINQNNIDKVLQSSEGKTLIGEINPDKQVNNYRILDKSTCKIEPLHISNIDLNKQLPETIKEFLSGKQVEMTTKSGASQKIGLSKTPAGWGIQISKQAFQITESSAEI